jgi:hypothetical protein
MSEPQPPEPGVELSKTTPELPAIPAPPPEPSLPPDVPEPHWTTQRYGSGYRDVCSRCGQSRDRHRNGARWWACWEIEAIQQEWDYWSQRRPKGTPPPELMSTPDYQPGVGMFPTYLAPRVPFWRQAWHWWVDR